MYTRIMMSTLIVPVLFLSSCIKASSPPPSETHISRATHYIDQGDYDTAIEILEKGLPYDNNSEMRLVLASAYAGRGGVKVENYWDYLIGFDAFAKEKSADAHTDIIPMNLIPEALDEKYKTALIQFNKDFAKLQQLEKKADKIPAIAAENRPDLLRARSLLLQVNTPSARLYRSILTVVVVKSELPEGNALLESWSKEKYDLCFPIANKVSVWFSNILYLIDEGLEDLSYAYPNDKSYSEMRRELTSGKAVTQHLTSYKTTAKSVCPVKK